MKRFVSSHSAKLLLVIAAVVLVVGVVSVRAQSPDRKDGPFSSPYEGMSRQEQLAKQTEQRAEFEKRYSDWLSAFAASGLNPRNLPLVTMALNPVPAQPTLDSAVALADAIVEGTVTRLEFFPRQMRITFRISDVVKGSSPDVGEGKEVTFLMLGGPYPNPDFKSGEFAFAENTGTLFEGDSALLFLIRPLEPHPPFPVDFFMQSYTGVYMIDSSGSVSPLDGNPFGDTVKGLTTEMFKSQIP